MLAFTSAYILAELRLLVRCPGTYPIGLWRPRLPPSTDNDYPRRHVLPDYYSNLRHRIVAKPLVLTPSSRKRTFSDSFGSDPLAPSTPAAAITQNLVVRPATSATSTDSKKVALEDFLASDLPALDLPALDALPLHEALDSITSADLFGDLDAGEPTVTSNWTLVYWLYLVSYTLPTLKLCTSLLSCDCKLLYFTFLCIPVALRYSCTLLYPLKSSAAHCCISEH